MRRFVLASLFAAACSFTPAPTAAPLREAAQVPVRISGTRVLIPVSVNGGAPSTFIFDTGASSTSLAREYATQRGIVATDKTEAVGAGGAGVSVGIAKNVGFSVGNLAIKVPRSPLLPLEPISLRTGQPMQGVLGYEALEPYVVTFDYAGSEVTFRPPGGFTPPAGAARVPIEFNHRLPVVPVNLTLLDGRKVPARLLLDTGAAMGLVLTRTFTDANRVEVENGIETSLGLGLGGQTRERIGRIKAVEIGGFTLDRPVINLSRDTAGALASTRIDGLIGGELLRRFSLTTDYRGKQIFLEPNADFAVPIEFDQVGALLTTRDATFESIVVREVLPGSPAAEAGVQVGDELRSVDGRRVRGADLDEIRSAFRKPSQRYRLGLVREGKELEVSVATRPFV